MPDFLARLTESITRNRDRLSETLRDEAVGEEGALRDLLLANWHPLPGDLFAERRPRTAIAVDGSIRQVNLANGAYLFVAQALCVGDGVEESLVDMDVLRGTAREGSVKRLSDLLLQYLEIRLARQCVDRLPDGGVLYLDGALYGRLPQLYPLRLDDDLERPFPEQTVDDFLYLFRQCSRQGRRVDLIAIAKTSREDTHSQVWRRVAGCPIPLSIPDAEMIYRWTEGKAGFSTPVVLGSAGFSGGPERLLRERGLGAAPAIVSFYVRLSDYDEAMRVELPACCLGDHRTLSDVEEHAALDLLQYDVTPILATLAADYGGPEVYNALLYSADLQVRLGRQTMNQVYLRLIESLTGQEVRLDRSERRF